MKRKELTYTDRLIIEKLYPVAPVSEIARIVSRVPSTIYREIKRGLYLHRNGDYTEVWRYSADIAQQKHDFCVSSRGIVEKCTHKTIATYRSLIIDGGRSVRAAVGELKVAGKETVSYTTLYRYVRKGYIEGVAMEERRVKRKKVTSRARRAPAGVSIERRPESINQRSFFGDWEMDCVVGRAKGRDEVMLVLSERYTRFEIIWKMHNKSARSVCSSLRQIVRKYGRIFNTITVDNGTEFSDYNGIKKFTNEVYYCHPYCSCERGTNENINRMIRWRYPKGTSFKKITNRDCQRLASWINHYPRVIFGGRTAYDQFKKFVPDYVDDFFEKIATNT